jgi:hypothetical protein
MSLKRLGQKIISLAGQWLTRLFKKQASSKKDKVML